MMSPARIKTIRLAAGLTQRDLATILKINNRKTVTRWELGEVEITGPASIILEMIDADELPERYWKLLIGVS